MPVPTFIEEPRFPEDIAYGSGGGPEFRTHVFEGHSGVEQRQASWTVSRARFDVGYGIRDQADMDIVRAFFYNAHGMASGFRFKDHADFEITDGFVAEGDSSTTLFQTIKRYTIGTTTVLNFDRPITKIVDGTYSVYVDGVLQVDTVDYTIDITTGIINFVGGAPGVFDITITCEFDVPVRFDTDHLAANHDGFDTESWDSIPLVELL